MGGDDQSRRTKRFTREELAVLADKARGDDPAEVVTQPAEHVVAENGDEVATPEAVVPEVTPMSRSQTLHDPLTTQLLAEVARRLHQTIELEPLTDDGQAAHSEDSDELAHPNLRRRRT